MSWKRFALNQQLDPTSSELQDLPVKIDNSDVGHFVSKFKNMNICCRNTDFKEVLNRHVDFKDPFSSVDGGSAAWAESSKGHCRLIKSEFDTIRNIKCSIVVFEENLCPSCKAYKKQLSTFRERVIDLEQNAEKCSDTSHMNFHYITIQEMEDHAYDMHT